MSENKFKTTEGVAKKIWFKVKKKDIKFGDVTVNETDDVITKEWISTPLNTGAIVSLRFSHKKGTNKNGKKRNPRYIIALTHNDKTENFSGGYARKVFNRLSKGIPKKRSNKITADVSTFAEQALSDI